MEGKVKGGQWGRGAAACSVPDPAANSPTTMGSTRRRVEEDGERREERKACPAIGAQAPTHTHTFLEAHRHNKSVRRPATGEVHGKLPLPTVG